uniref:ABC transporter permease n=1 Tax=Candidatus Hakubella thermalkaliphila TaxID=2754717 RepID=UPI0015948421
MIAHLREIFKYRELLFNLIRRDLKVKYRGSILGFFWSLLNPILMTLVYSFVFSRVIRAGIEDFAVFFISVLLPWNLLANSVNGGVNSGASQISPLMN